MSPVLPSKPSIEQLKKFAKDLLRRQRAGDASVVTSLRLLPRFGDVTDVQILSADLTLAEAQQAVAMAHGYKNWQVVQNLVVNVLTPDPALPTADYYRDYHWSRKGPVGDHPLPVPPTDADYFKFVRLASDVRVEQYNARGEFVRICYDPSDYADYARKLFGERDGNRQTALCLDADGCVMRYEKYTFLTDGAQPLVRAEIYTPDGRLIETHIPKEVPPDGQDIAVTDGLGKPRLILHHRGLSKGAPVDISQEWAE